MTWSMTSAEFQELLRDAEPPTADDVTIALDGRRLDTKEKLLDWLSEIEPVVADLRARRDPRRPAATNHPVRDQLLTRMDEIAGGAQRRTSLLPW